MTRSSKKDRIAALESDLAQVIDRLDQLEATISDRAPASEIERLNYAFELIADRAPLSEVERLNHAFELIAASAPVSEIERLNLAYAHIDGVKSELLSRISNLNEKRVGDVVRVDSLLQQLSDQTRGKSLSEIQLGRTADRDDRFDALYVQFENLHRGPREEILKRLEVYRDLLDLDALHRLGPAIDLGSGRGEWLEFVAECGFEAYGVDLNSEIAAVAIERGFKVLVEDLVSHVRSLAPRSASLISMFHVAEHLSVEVLADVIRAAFVALVPGGALIVETPNPTNLRVGAASFYVDPTHLRPLHPLLLRFLLEDSGFDSIKTVFLNPGDETLSIAAEDPEQQRLIRIINESLLSPLDYTMVAEKDPGTTILT